MKMKKKVSAVLSGILFLFGLTTLSPATAASTFPSLRWDAAGSSGFAWSLYNKAANEDVANFTKYFTPDVKLIDVVAQVGSTIKLSWIVKDASGNALPNTPVTLVLNPGYTVGTANTEFQDGRQTPIVSGKPSDGLLVPLTTDASGKLSFSIVNKDSTGESSVPNDGVTIPAGKQYTQLAVWLGTYSTTSARDAAQRSQDVDILEIHFLTEAKAPTPTPVATPTPTPTPVATPTPTPTPTPTVVAPKLLPSMRLVSPVYGPSNSVDTTGDIAQWYSAKTRAYYTYIAAGSTLTLKYLVTKD